MLRPAEESAGALATDIGPERKPDAGAIQRGDIPRNPFPVGARRRCRLWRAAGQRLLHLFDHRGGDRVAQGRLGEPPRLGSVDVEPRRKERQREEDLRPFLQQSKQLVVHVAITDRMKEPIDARPKKTLRIVERRDVCEHAQLMLVRLVDDGAIQDGAQLRHRAVAVVDPDLDEVDVLRRQFPDVLSGLALAGDAIRRIAHRRVRTGIGRSEAAPCRPNDRAWMRIVAQPKREVAAIGARAADGRNAEVGETIQLVDDRVAGEVLGTERRTASVTKMRVDVHERRHHGLAAQVHPPKAGRRLQLSLPAHAHERIALHDERRSFDGGTAVTGDQTRAVEQHGRRVATR